MPDEQPVNDLAARARMHAALGEPVRLAMVDQLALGDASPGELGAVVDLPTNLLAHHLRSLEDAGLVRRVRSEGDKRRSYVQLRWEDPDVARLLSAAAVTHLGVVPRVVFVCTRNSARSQLAAAVWSRVSRIPTDSAGTHPAEQVHPRAVAVARRHGLRLAPQRTRHLDDALRPGDLVVAVCDNAHEELAARPEPTLRTAHPAGRDWLHWAVPDPVRLDTDAAFDTAYTDLGHRIDRLAAALAPGDVLAPGHPQRRPGTAGTASG